MARGPHVAGARWHGAATSVALVLLLALHVGVQAASAAASTRAAFLQARNPGVDAAGSQQLHPDNQLAQEQQQKQQQEQEQGQMPADPVLPHVRPRDAPMHSPFNAEASLQLAARQSLFDYAVDQGLTILDAAVRRIAIPEYSATLDIPLVGGVDVSVSKVSTGRDAMLCAGLLGLRERFCRRGGGSRAEL